MFVEQFESLKLVLVTNESNMSISLVQLNPDIMTPIVIYGLNKKPANDGLQYGEV